MTTKKIKPVFTIPNGTKGQPKFLLVRGASLEVQVDFDDVDHKAVRADVKKMVDILNTRWNQDPELARLEHVFVTSAVALEEATVGKPGRYLIMRTNRFCGNSCMWWGPNGANYTFDIDEAGRYTLEEAIDCARGPEDQVYEETDVLPKVSRHLDAQRLRDIPFIAKKRGKK